MHRASKFLQHVEDHALELMEKFTKHGGGLREMELIEGVCDLHNAICEFIDIKEKRGSTHGTMFNQNPHKY